MRLLLSTRRSAAGDVLVAALLAGVDIGVAGNLLRDSAEPAWQLPESIGVAVAIAVLLVFRRRLPLAVFAAVLAVSFPAALLGVLWDPFVAATFALYPVVLSRPRKFATLATAGVAVLAVAAAGLGEVLRPGWAWWYVLGLPLAMGVLAWGRLVNDRRDQAIATERQREHQLVVDERLRIARELHDVVTHGMGLIAVKAGIANHLAQTRPDEARDALRIIEATSRESLTELRRLLGVLREDIDLAPAPTLDALPELVERASMAAVEVELVVDERRDVPPPVELAAYRIVQEAVTNVVKHAAPGRCRVEVRATSGLVAIDVTDDGRGTRGAGRPGHGLVGMRERVALYGGEFTAGPGPSGGFTVSATLRYQPVGGRE